MEAQMAIHLKSRGVVERLRQRLLEKPDEQIPLWLALGLVEDASRVVMMPPVSLGVGEQTKTNLKIGETHQGESTSEAPATEEPAPVKVKRTRNWTPEQRAKQAEVMRQNLARRKEGLVQDDVFRGDHDRGSVSPVQAES